ncbi:MAG TPA: PQQ-binding-like beta-propeller repeat protein [Nitriliruptorales bacterium]
MSRPPEVRVHTCPACGLATPDARFCGACGHRLATHPPPDTADARTVRASATTTTERPPGRDPHALRNTLATVTVVALAAGLFTLLRPTPEIVHADRWRGDGTGRTSTHAAMPERVLWSINRLGATSFDVFRETVVVPVGTYGDLVLGVAGGQLLAVDTTTGEVRWEREVGRETPELVGDRILLPLGPGVAELGAQSGEEVRWLATEPAEGVPSHIVAADERTIVVSWTDGPDHGIAAYDRDDGHRLWSRRSAQYRSGDGGDLSRLLLSTNGGVGNPVFHEVELRTREQVSPPLPPGSILAFAGDWVALEARDGVRVHNVAQATTTPIDFVQVVALHPRDDGVVVLGLRIPPPSPPRGGLEALLVDPGAGTATPIVLDAGFGDVLASRPGGVLASSGSLIRLVDIGRTGPTRRWERGVDPTVTVAAIGDLVVQLGRDRWFGIDADTGVIAFDLDVAGAIPGPDRRAEVRSQPYLRADGFVLDSADTLTQVIDPIGGVRVDVRGSVHVAATPAGDVVRRGDVIELLDRSGQLVWRIEARGSIHPGGIAVTPTHLAALTQSGTGASTIASYALDDASFAGELTSPAGSWHELHRLGGDRLLLIGDTTALVEVSPTGPRMAWHTQTALPVDVTVIVDDAEVVLVSRSAVQRLDLASGAASEIQRLPRLVDPIVANDGGTLFATSGTDLVALDLASLEERWASALGDRATSAPTLAGDRIYVGTQAGHVIVLDRSGTVTDRLDTGFAQPVLGAPTVANGVVYVFADRGRRLVAFGSP